MPPIIRSQLLEARLQAAENEVQSLQSLLGKEKKDALQKNRLQKLSSGGGPTATTAKGKDGDAPPNSPARSRTPLRTKEHPKSSTPMRSPRKSADLSKRVETVSIAVMAEKERVLNEEISTLRKEVTESRTLIQSLREEVARKTRLVASLKAARQAEGTAADHWRMEAQANEENLKRAQRAVGTKDAIIKDLRAKLEVQADDVEREGGGHPRHESASDSAQPADLKSRLKAAELEKTRIRARLSVVRDRLSEAESEIKGLKEENIKLAKAAEKCESFRNAVARKDAQLRSIKSQMETVQSESQDELQESDKRIK
jgi:hypothetical protein